MLKTAREKTILKHGLIVVGIMAVLYVFVLSPFLNEGSSILDEELERKTTQINKFFSRTGSMPSKNGFKKLEEGKIKLENSLEELIDFVDPIKMRISEGRSEAGLYFIERLHSSVKKFQKEIGSKEIELPENLGFGDGLPKETMVDSLLRQLETAELVVDILLKGDKWKISAIKPLRSIKYIESLSKEVLYTELPVQISMTISSDDLINMLLLLKNNSPVVSVKEIHLRSETSGNDEAMEVSLILSTFIVARKTE